MMTLNYFKTGIRNLLKRKGYTLLNVSGLALGMTSCLLIFHYVSYERSYDTSIKRADDIYRIRLDNYRQGKLAWRSATSYPAITPAMKRDFPEVENYCRLIDADMLLSNDARNAKFKESKGYFAEQSFIEMFSLDFISGNPSRALLGPDKIIVSEKMAARYFGSENALGKFLTVKDSRTPQVYEVTGVFREYPRNSHLIIDFMASFDTFKKMLREGGDTTNVTETGFGWYDFYSYIQLEKGADVKKLQAKLPDFCAQYLDDSDRPGNYHELYLTPVKDIHLYSNYNQEAEVNGNGQMVSFLFLIAIFVICIAWVNYINLSTARSMERAKEVGMKKVLGAVRSDLMKQFLIENIIINGMALIPSVLLFFLLLKPFDLFAGRENFTEISLTNSYWQTFLLLFLFGTFLSGLYPAFILSGFKPVTVLKGVFKNSAGGLTLRKCLIVMQFSITVILLAGTIIVYQQVQFMREQNLGASIEQTLVLEGPSAMEDSVYKSVYQPFKTELLQQNSIMNVCASSIVMGKEIYWTNGSRRLDAPGEEAVTLYNLGVDYDFIPAFDLSLKAGRNFSEDFGMDRATAILNEKAVTLLGFRNADEAVNSRIKRMGDTLTVIGVVADFHQLGLQKTIDPMIILPRPNMRRFYSIKIKPDDTKATLAATERIWNKYFPTDPFSFFFLDETYNAQYKSDNLFGKVFGIFSFLAIFIACSGLLGLSAYNILQRNKEIGIRKVLGASVKNILMLLSIDFIKVIAVSLLIAFPLGWYVMSQWLQDFAYRIEIRWWVFIISGIGALMIAALTIVSQAMKAVVENPVKSLRTE